MTAEPFNRALDKQPIRPFQGLVVGLVMLALVLDGLDYQLLALVAPVILVEWDIGPAEFGAAMAAALFGMAIGAAAGGWIGDRIGRLRMLVISTLLFGAVTMAISLVDSAAMLAVLRTIGGIGFGAAGPNAIALASEWVPARLRTYVVALLAIGTPAGGMVAALALPHLLPMFGWRGVFLIFGLAAAILAMIILALLRESPPWLIAKGRTEAAQLAARRVMPGGIDLTAAPSFPTDHLTLAPASRLFSPANLRMNVGLGLSFASLTAIVYGLGAWLPSTLTAAGFSLDQALQASLALSGSSIAGALAAGYLARAVGSRRLMAVGSVGTCILLGALGVAIDSFSGTSDAAIRTVCFLTGAIGATASIGVTTLYAMAALLYPPEIRSGGIGLGMTMGRIGGIVMAFSGGYLLDFAAGSAIVLFGVLAASALIALTSVYVVRRHIPRQSVSQPRADLNGHSNRSARLVGRPRGHE